MKSQKALSVSELVIALPCDYLVGFRGFVAQLHSDASAYMETVPFFLSLSTFYHKLPSSSFILDIP